MSFAYRIYMTLFFLFLCYPGLSAAQEQQPNDGSQVSPPENARILAIPHLALDPATGRSLYYYNSGKDTTVTVSTMGMRSFENTIIKDGFGAVAADYLFLRRPDSAGEDDEYDWMYFESPNYERLPGEFKLTSYTSKTLHLRPISSFRLFPGQFVGVEFPVWRLKSDSDFWTELGRRAKQHNRDFLIHTDGFMYGRPLPSPLENVYIRITPQRYMQFEKMAKDPAFAGGVIRDQLSMPFKGKKYERGDYADFEYRLLLDPDSGRLFTYGIYRGEEPANIDVNYDPSGQTPIFDVMAMSRRMFMQRQEKGEDGEDMEVGALPLTEEVENNGECIVFPYTYEGTDEEEWAQKEEQARMEAWESWRQEEGNWLTFYPGMVFGGECFIWDLKIWPLLGRRLAEQGQPYILYNEPTVLEPRLNHAPLDITKVPRDLAVLVDLDLYHRMEALRKAYLEPRDRGNDAFEGDDPAAE